MKIAVITSRERCEKFSDKSMIPEGAELVYFEQGYTAREVIERAGDAEFAVIDAVLPFTAEMIEGMPKLRMIHSEGVGYAAIDIETAIKLYSREAAIVCGFDRLGQLKEGYRASFLVMEDDVLEVPAEEIGDVRVAATYIDGEKCYSLN